MVIVLAEELVLGIESKIAKPVRGCAAAVRYFDRGNRSKVADHEVLVFIPDGIGDSPVRIGARERNSLTIRGARTQDGECPFCRLIRRRLKVQGIQHVRIGTNPRNPCARLKERQCASAWGRDTRAPVREAPGWCRIEDVLNGGVVVQCQSDNGWLFFRPEQFHEAQIRVVERTMPRKRLVIRGGDIVVGPLDESPGVVRDLPAGEHADGLRNKVVVLAEELVAGRFVGIVVD